MLSDFKFNNLTFKIVKNTTSAKTPFMLTLAGEHVSALWPTKNQNVFSFDLKKHGINFLFFVNIETGVVFRPGAGKGRKGILALSSLTKVTQEASQTIQEAIKDNFQSSSKGRGFRPLEARKPRKARLAVLSALKDLSERVNL